MKVKTIRLTVRLTEEESDKLNSRAEEAGLNKSEYLRDCILENTTQIIKKEDAIKVIYHLSKMGNNLNQIAHGINKAFFESIVTEDLMEKYLRQLNMVQNQQRLFLDLLGIRKNKD